MTDKQNLINLEEARKYDPLVGKKDEEEEN